VIRSRRSPEKRIASRHLFIEPAVRSALTRVTQNPDALRFSGLRHFAYPSDPLRRCTNEPRPNSYSCIDSCQFMDRARARISGTEDSSSSPVNLLNRATTCCEPSASAA